MIDLNSPDAIPSEQVETGIFVSLHCCLCYTYPDSFSCIARSRGE